MAIVHNICSVKARPVVTSRLQLNVLLLLQVEQVGQGTFGTVFHAVQLGTDSLPDVAIKLLPRGAMVSCRLHIASQACVMQHMLHSSKHCN